MEPHTLTAVFKINTKIIKKNMLSTISNCWLVIITKTKNTFNSLIFYFNGYELFLFYKKKENELF